MATSVRLGERLGVNLSGKIRYFRQFALPDWINLIAGIITIAGVVLAGYSALLGIESNLLFGVLVYLCAVLLIFVVANFLVAYVLHKTIVESADLRKQIVDIKRELREKLTLFNKVRRRERTAAQLFNKVSSAFAAYEIFVERFRGSLEKDDRYD